MLLKATYILILTSLTFSVSAQNLQSQTAIQNKKRLLDIRVTKTGPYFGYARGKYDAFELGIERMYKHVKLIHPITHGFHTGFDYNFKHNVLGFEAGYWYKSGRLGLTFGADAVLRTNFDENRFGIGPSLGYRLMGFHLQAGYHFLTPADQFVTCNTFFIRLRFTLVNNRDVDINSGFGDLFKRKKK